VSANLLALHDREMLTRFSPRQVWGDGNCLYRAVSLALYGTQKYHVYLRAVTAFYIIEHNELYDPHDPSFVLHETCVCSPSIRSVISLTLTDGSYAELVHIFALSAAMNITIQSYCTPGTHNISDVHPYTIRIGSNNFECRQPDINNEVIITLLPNYTKVYY